ncbi:SMI1/KNR4 family protein [Kitasatospora gansuensis]
MPTGPGGLNPPATEEQIQTAERAVGHRFPEEIRASYLLHDGGYLPSSDEHPEWGPPIEILPLHRIAELHEGLLSCRDTWCDHQDGDEDCGCEWNQRNGDPVRQGNSWYPGWLPLHDGGDSSYRAVDLVPLRGGRVGQVICVDCGPPTQVEFGSFLDLLRAWSS